MAGINFNAVEVQSDAGFSLIPAGTYLAQVVDSDVKTTRAGNGQYVALQFEILDGEFKGRRVFSNINVMNPNAEAQRIGQAQLSALCRAVNVMQLVDTAQLHGRPLKIKVSVRKDATYGDSNEVKGFEAAGVVQAPAPAATPAAGPAVPRGSGNSSLTPGATAPGLEDI